MRPIPKQLRNDLSNDPFYKQCAITGKKNEKIDWHHNLIFGGSQVNERFAIIPLLKSVHDKIHLYKEICDWIMWNRATPEQISYYSKAQNYAKTKEYLNSKYGDYREGDSKVYSRLLGLEKGASMENKLRA